VTTKVDPLDHTQNYGQYMQT